MKIDDPLIKGLQKIIRFSVRLLAILMTLVIFWGVLDVIYILFLEFARSPVGLLNMSDFLAIFGSFMAVLIAIEIFENIVLYLKDEVIHLKIVLATALMAVARKVIIFDFEKMSYNYIWSTGIVIIALSIAYYLLITKNREAKSRKVRVI